MKCYCIKIFMLISDLKQYQQKFNIHMILPDFCYVMACMFCYYFLIFCAKENKYYIKYTHIQIYTKLLDIKKQRKSNSLLICRVTHLETLFLMFLDCFILKSFPKKN